jgi:nitrate/TMAO reductase-like tetraheme cytochrome c subunit
MRSVRRHLFLYFIGVILIGTVTVLRFATQANAAPIEQASQNNIQQPGLPNVTSAEPIVSNETCLGCHGQPGLTMTLLNGDVLDLYVNPDVYTASIHGKDGYACVQCHTNLGEYPHPLFTATNLRDATLRLTNLCDRCHSGEYNLTMDSVHYDKLAIGIKEAAVCTDCHGSHDVHQWIDPKTQEILPEARLSIPATCSKCHNAIYQKYRTSVHGAALTDEANTDVPTCIDCHGVHNIGNPTTAEFRLKSPELCAGCHTSPNLMDKYGISTNVLNTYVADFHGTTVTLFQKQSPDAQTNKPVCYDCHGVHDISRVDDPKTGLDMQQNLLIRCKVCHPDATSNFPSAWMSHYIPSPDHYSLVYYVNLFYKFFIPAVLGFMVAMVGLDVGHTAYIKTRRGKRHLQSTSTAVQPDTAPESSTQPPSSAGSTDQPAQSDNIEIKRERSEQSELNKPLEQSDQADQKEEPQKDNQSENPDEEVTSE